VMFFKEIDRTNDILNQPTHDVFKKYNEFCLANGFTAMSRGEFSKQVNRKYKTTTKQKKIQGKKYQIFCEKE
ncbi:primase-like DNA-binding domain-containing protein, partial [Pseudomonas aeruginosa]